MLNRGLLVAIAVLGLMAGCGAGGSGDPTGGSTKAAAGQLTLKKVGTFNQPTYVVAPPNDKSRLFVVEKTGKIRVLRNGKKLSKPFLNLTSKVSSDGERGLLSMAFAPGYGTSGKFYVDYTDTKGDTRIVEYRRSRKNSNIASKSARQLLKINQPYPNHNGGQLQFGPDGFLYIGMGDGGSAGDPENRAQDLGSLLGKLLRIDPNPGEGKPYTAPSSNPFVGKSGARPEVYSYGLRNPWRFSFDRLNGDLYIGDVGQDKFEEVDYDASGEASGINFGWPAFEGDKRYDPDRSAPGAQKPVIVESHDDSNCSITGGYVVRTGTLPSLSGRYLYTDFCNGVLKSFKIDGKKAVDQQTHSAINASSVSSFGEDAQGRIYMTSLEGPVFRLVEK